jgi:hypothetical protein
MSRRSSGSARTHLALSAGEEIDQLRQEVRLAFTPPPGTRYRTALDLEKAWAWKRMTKAFGETGTRLGTIAYENSDAVPSHHPIPTNLDLSSWAGGLLDDAREANEAREYLRFRSSGGSKRVPRVLGGGDLRALFQAHFAMARRTAAAKACRQIDLLRGGHSNADRGSPTTRPQKSRRRKILFVKRNGGMLPKRPFDNYQLLNSYESFSHDLRAVRTFVRGKNGAISITQLKKRFAGTGLRSVATDEWWREWIEIFGEKKAAAPGNVAFVLLERVTGLSRKTIMTRCSRARAPRNSARTIKGEKK